LAFSFACKRMKIESWNLHIGWKLAAVKPVQNSFYSWSMACRDSPVVIVDKKFSQPLVGK